MNWLLGESCAGMIFGGSAPRLENGLCQWPWSVLGCTINYTRSGLWKEWQKLALSLVCHYSTNWQFQLEFSIDILRLRGKDFRNARRLSMATVPAADSRKALSNGRDLISFEEAMEKLSRDDRFRATVYAMNTLLVQKGVYSPEEFEFQFRQFAQKQLK
jgi:hypothetical protein